MSELKSNARLSSGSISSHGYRLIYVGKSHHLADVRGYAYEHRVVAEQKIGRKLVEGEIVHHINEDKQDNRPENLEVVADIAAHKALHRMPGSDRRLPGDSNPVIECACGCGGTLDTFDDFGRRRSFLAGHTRKGTGKRNDESLVSCKCGCGEQLRKYDHDGRERRYASGHNGKSRKLPTLNPDGTSVKGCNFIYPPRGQAGEYAPLASNPYRFCGMGCAYCYVPKVLKVTRGEFDSGASARSGFLESLAKDAWKYQAVGITEQVMFSFTSDVYNPFDTSITRRSLEIIAEHGMGFCVLTKGGRKALADIDLYRPDRDAFASTLTSTDDEFSLKWERGAALPKDRMDTLKAFHDAGIFTWVSLEPTLDTASSLEIIERTHEYVDLYKIGRANYLPMTYTTDWESYTHQILELVNRLKVKHYIKKDLQKYLPSGYYNPLRIAQHN